MSDLDVLARLLKGHIDEYCSALQRAMEGALEARARLGESGVGPSCASIESTHVWVCRSLDLWEEMMDLFQENGVAPAHG
ncbi:MAG: hypothetical protein QOK29_5510 [Rhodospirillaceae bacterium]|nr:hypothetical protein [Miltoncostaeaceae bacterium]MEA2783878.1 hypothetical protein [Rhodospirillaceae bacterium]